MPARRPSTTGAAAVRANTDARSRATTRSLPTARSAATRSQLLDAAERLFAEHGPGEVTVRAIVAHAAQRNASALHYHFSDRAGLLRALHARRNAQVQARRTELVDARLAHAPAPSLRDICTLMVAPAFQLACADAGFRRYIRAFSEWSATTTMPAARQLEHGLERGTLTTRELLRNSLSHLDDDLFAQRFDSAVRFATLSMSVQARQRNAFRGPQATLFLELLLDAMAGLLSAEVSPQTKDAAAAARASTAGRLAATRRATRTPAA